MSKFKIGQKVVCKDDSDQNLYNRTIYHYLIHNGGTSVIKGNIYTISGITSDGDLFLLGMNGGIVLGIEIPYNKDRFEPLKYDIVSNKSIIEEMIEERADIEIKEPEKIK